MNISAVIEPGRVLCNVEARSKKHSLDILSELLANADEGLSQATVFDSLIVREKVGCTAMEGGIAIPHGRVPGIDRIYGAFIRLGRPVDYDTPDGTPVDLILGLIVPADGDEDYSAELNGIASVFCDTHLLRGLRKAGSSRQIYELLAGVRAPMLASG